MTTQTTPKPNAKPAAPKTGPATQPTAQPVTAAAPPKREKKASVDIDFGKLSVVEAERPQRAGGGRAKTWQPHEMLLSALRDSWNRREVLTEIAGKPATYIGAGKAITVPADAAGTLATAIRKHAAHLGYGCAVKESDPDKNGNVTVSFAAKTPKQRKQS
jgi:hypothetical protein